MYPSVRNALFACVVPCMMIGGVAMAQSSGVPGGFKHDSTQPIEISADALEVRQEQQTAVFTGSVDARQGDVRMQADRLIVSYDPDANDGGGEQSAIRSVRAEGSVFITGTEQSAQGDWANYDVASGVIVMGDTVTLTQGVEGTVLGGGKLRIDLNAGNARIESGELKTDGTRERVGAIFVPTKK